MFLLPYLGYGLIVDVDQIAWSRINLECLVEGKGGFDNFGGCIGG